MRSVQWTELKKTFRFRLAMLHVAMVVAALTATFLVVLAVVRSFELAAGQKHMDASIRQARMAYLGSSMEEETEQLPEALLNRVEEQFPNLRIGLVNLEERPGGVLYEITTSSGREWLEILADPSGDIWVADRKSMPEMFTMLKDTAQADGEVDLDFMICSPDGELLEGTPPEDLTPAMFKELTRARGYRDETTIIRKGADLFGVTVLFDENILLAVGSLEEMEQITRWSAEFFVMAMIIFVPLSAWSGLLLSRKAMAGVSRVADAAGRVQAGNFKERVPRLAEGTEIEELVDAFNTMVARIDVLMRELREVTANIAHDLKTPVMRIRGLIEGSKWEEISPPEREQMIASAIEECDRIMPLIDSVLELSRAESGMLVLQQEPFDFAEEVRNAHEMFSTLAEDECLAFDCHVPEQAVPMVGDRRRMQRVIANLFDNAIKFTPEGGHVAVRLAVSGGKALLTVQDDGPGIPKEEQENVFKRFYRLDPSRGTTPGHGMGLSLVRAFVHAFGGTVAIDSDKGKGCTVTVVVPTLVDKAGSSI